MCSVSLEVKVAVCYTASHTAWQELGSQYLCFTVCFYFEVFLWIEAAVVIRRGGHVTVWGTWHALQLPLPVQTCPMALKVLSSLNYLCPSHSRFFQYSLPLSLLLALSPFINPIISHNPTLTPSIQPPPSAPLPPFLPTFLPPSLPPSVPPSLVLAVGASAGCYNSWGSVCLFTKLEMISLHYKPFMELI